VGAVSRIVGSCPTHRLVVQSDDIVGEGAILHDEVGAGTAQTHLDLVVVVHGDTSKGLEVVEAELRDAGLIDYFEELVGGDAVKISKPDPEIYLIACDIMKVNPADAFAIEDSYNGIRSAYAAGMRPIMVPDMIPADDEMKKLSEVVCADLPKVIEYFKSV